LIKNVLGLLKKVKEFYIDHHIDFMEDEESADTYVIGIFIRVKAKEEQVKTVIPLIDRFIGALFRKGKIIIPVSKSDEEKIKRLTRIKLRFKGKGVID